jgi:hypothetical protein
MEYFGGEHMKTIDADKPTEGVFPYEIPLEKPDLPLSRAMERLYTRYSAPLARFDCDLRQGEHDPWTRETEHFWLPEVYFRSGLGTEVRQERERMARDELSRRR